MSVPGRVAAAVAANSRTVIVLLCLLTGALAVGVPMIETDVDLEEITGDSPAAQANDYVEENFTAAGEENTTAVLLVHTGENTLTRESLLRSLRLQQRIRDNRSVNRTLVADEPITGIENAVAIARNRSDRVDTLEDRADAIEARWDELNQTEERLVAGLDEIRALQREFESDTEEIDENSSRYRRRAARLEHDVDAVVQSVTRDLDDAKRSSYRGYADAVRRFETQLAELRRKYGEEATERARYGELKRKIRDNYDPATGGMVEGELFGIFSDFRTLEEEFEALEDADRPSLEDQIAALENENLSQSEFNDTVRDVLNGTGPRGSDVLRLVESSYRVNSTTAGARMTVLTQRTRGESGLEMGVTNETLIDAQRTVRALSTDGGTGETGNATAAGGPAGRYVVFGSGLVESEIDRSIVDTLWIVTPLALVLVVLALSIAYRDPLDILLGLVGIAVVLTWTFGVLGWVGIPFSVLLVAVPVLLIGIAIDFAVHVLMRHREHRTPANPGDSPGEIRPAMRTAVTGVGIALFWAAATTVIGFFANLVSPLSLIRQFGIASGVGIASALVVFTTFVPALKIELDELLESHGFDRQRRAFGTTGGLSKVLSVGGTAARRIPLVVVALLVVVTAASGTVAVDVDTTFQQEDFIAHSPPAWTASLPGPMAPGEYRTAEDLEVVNDHFRPADAEAQLLVKGAVNSTTTFERLVEARRTAANTSQVYVLPNGRADIQDPLSVMRRVAAENDTFNTTFRAEDTDGDGVPDRNVPALYDALFRADGEAASQVIHRTVEGEYAAVRLVIGVQGGTSYAETTAAVQRIATVVERGRNASRTAADPTTTASGRDTGGTTTTGDTSGVTTITENSSGVVVIGDTGGSNTTETNTTEGANVTATATGGSVVNRVIERALFETLTRSFVVTFVAVFLVLTVGYRLAGHGAGLGAITLVPVTLSVAWVLGTMALIGVPFNVLTVTITSLTIGLGVSYSIHVSARYRLELDRQGNAWRALHTTLTGTGGALLGSVTTTAAAFGTLALAVLPVLAQFGLITAITIVYAFLASVLALPTLLILWTRYARADVSLRPPGETAADGGESDT
jgi:predicted RND superfamily exporter protein